MLWKKYLKLNVNLEGLVLQEHNFLFKPIINKLLLKTFYIKHFYISIKCFIFIPSNLKTKKMKVIVENPVRLVNLNRRFLGEQKYFETLSEFNLLLTRIINSESEENLRSSTRLDTYENFMFGFGSNHMWVKQIVDGEPLQQVIFVQF